MIKDEVASPRCRGRVRQCRIREYPEARPWPIWTVQDNWKVTPCVGSLTMIMGPLSVRSAISSAICNQSFISWRDMYDIHDIISDMSWTSIMRAFFSLFYIISDSRQSLTSIMRAFFRICSGSFRLTVWYNNTNVQLLACKAFCCVAVTSWWFLGPAGSPRIRRFANLLENIGWWVVLRVKGPYALGFCL